MHPRAYRTVSYAAAQIDDPDGVKTSFSTSASPVSLDASDYDGALVALTGTVWLKGLPRTVTISRTLFAGAYTTDPIVLTGFWNGSQVTESLTPADTDGGDVIRGTQLWDRLPTIAIPAQANTSGAFTIGAGDIGAHDRFSGVEVAATGALNVQYGLSETDTIPAAQMLPGEVKPIEPSRILTDPALTTPTTVGLTVYI